MGRRGRRISSSQEAVPEAAAAVLADLRVLAAVDSADPVAVVAEVSAGRVVAAAPRAVRAVGVEDPPAAAVVAVEAVNTNPLSSY